MGRMTFALAATALAVASGTSVAATFNLSLSPHQFSTIRIEPPRPGGLYGLPRGTQGLREGEVAVDKPASTHKRRAR